MKHSPRLLPYCTIIAGVLGFLLRLWLYAGINSQGLLPSPHIAQALLWVLTALFLVFLALYIRRLAPFKAMPQHFSVSVLSAVGAAAGALAIVCFAFAETASHRDPLSFLTLAAGIFAAAGLLTLSYCRFKAKTPSLLSFVAAIVFIILYTVSQCRIWGSEPQLQKYVFHLFAWVFLMLSVYHHAVFAVQGSDYKKLVFCNQAALFFCCLSLNTSILYLPLAVWMGTDLIVPREA